MDIANKQLVEAGPQAIRWKAHKKKILTVAANLFWEKGYIGTSIDEIAKKANMNKALIYYYFENKVSLLNEIISAPLEEMVEAARPIANSNLEPMKKVESLVTFHIKWQLSHYGLAGIGHLERKNLTPKFLRKYVQMRDEYENLFLKVIEEGLEKGQFSFDNGKMGAVFTLGLLTSITQWYKPKGRFSPDKIASLACSYVLGALARRGSNGKGSKESKKSKC